MNILLHTINVKLLKKKKNMNKSTHLSHCIFMPRRKPVKEIATCKGSNYYTHIFIDIDAH